jgi:hypothetical protein
MKNLQSILANLLLLAFIAACAKKESNNSEKSKQNLDFEKYKLQLNNSKILHENNDHLIDERPYYEL